MTRVDWLNFRLERLINKGARIDMKIENTIAELKYFERLEDDHEEWSDYEDF